MNDKEIIDVLKEALLEISCIQNEPFGSDWQEIEAARNIANKALKETESVEEKIGRIWDNLGGYDAFCKNFGYQQFAKKILEEFK